ncbi:MAG: hypothetical protein WBC92_12890, partial [Terracidiphilus sp.]
MHRVRWWLCAAVCAVLVLASVRAGNSQSSNGNGSGQSTMHPPFSPRADMGTDSGVDYDPVMMERRMRALNIERQK